MTDLFFCPERWEPDESVSTNAASPVRVRGSAGKTVDAWQLGDWSEAWTAITSRIPIEAGWLEPGAEYRFCFWLNGGENDRRDEVCELEIYGDAWEERLRFKLNREQTKPILEKNGWLLFGIPFTAPEAGEFLTFRFVAAGAVCTIAGIPDMDMAACEALPPDERSFEHPQRHNIVFPHGWPEDDIVVLKARGKKLEIRRKTLTFGVLAAGAAIGLAALLGHRGKKRK